MKFKEKKLELMVKELKKAPKLYYPSSFWNQLNKEHISQLKQLDINNFKRTINMQYFNWEMYDIFRHHLPMIFQQFLKGNFHPFFESRIKNLNSISSVVYRIYIAYLFDYVKSIDRLNILDKIEEPLIGNPILVEYKNKLISQDICNSVHEFYSIIEKVKIKKNMKFAETGAGYGRLAYIFLKTFPKAKFCIIDIPPALYVAQEYLTTVFPNEKAFLFRSFKSFKKVKKQFENAKIKFLMPHQMKYLPKAYFDIQINISSLHEMTRLQIKNLLKQIDRVSNDGYFYSKQWMQSKIKDNDFITEKEYPIPKKWKKLYSRQHNIQQMFFESVYKTN